MSTRILKLTLLAASLSLAARIYGQVYPNAKTGGNYMYNYYFPPAASSTPWWPSWSPDGQWIAFAMDGSIWKARVGDSTAYEVVYAKEYLSSPEWSPDGKWIAYTADDDGRSINLMLFNVDTGKSTALTTGNFENLEPAWSPDGKELIFVSDRDIPLGSGAIWRAPAIADVMQTGKARIIHKEETLFRTRPQWSPDGKRLINP